MVHWVSTFRNSARSFFVVLDSKPYVLRRRAPKTNASPAVRAADSQVSALS